MLRAWDVLHLYYPCVLFALVLDLASEPSLSPDLVSEALAPVAETCVIEL